MKDTRIDWHCPACGNDDFAKMSYHFYIGAESEYTVNCRVCHAGSAIDRETAEKMRGELRKVDTFNELNATISTLRARIKRQDCILDVAVKTLQTAELAFKECSELLMEMRKEGKR
jgi:exonuclease VII small subunit